MDEEWKQRIKKDMWWAKDDPSPEMLKSNIDQRMLSLRDSLLKFGGEAVCMPSVEEDLEKLLSRGQLWSGVGSKLMKGRPISCHENSCNLWEANQDKLFISTGYALSDDGMWRQHSWCVFPKARSVNMIETTVKRELYFGFVMTLDEIEDFGLNNTDTGIEVKPETRDRFEGILQSVAKNKVKPK